MTEKMYEYYAKQDVQPTYADFSSDAELSRYAQLRKNVFFRLSLPLALFQGKEVLEFGPDTGENSIVFAQWGARVTLVEPNAEAHPYIRQYFSRFSLESNLTEIVTKSVLDFEPARQYDFVDAEGFIYTVQPTSAWVSKLHECLKPDGIALVTYVEKYGSFMELLLKAIYQTALRHGQGEGGIETARHLFLPKWNSIAHTRKIESWFMDVIQNPFVRMKYFIDPAQLLREMHAGHFRLYSAWPNYKDVLAMNWIKGEYRAGDDNEAAIAYIEQSRLSHVLSTQCLLPAPSPTISNQLAELVGIVDGLIDNAAETNCLRAVAILDELIAFLAAGNIIASPEDAAKARTILTMIKTAMTLMGQGKVDELTTFCREDSVFIATWGMPNHHGVFQKL
ncbi:class I SAM-dependent methyltransferase [Herbaspirillum sp. WGmk3]|uniref:class I SAM-dependent methyltransferase n=1 Tax=Herbaspirillum sp. WGmk3 TaxID=2919925 RepID=UPI0020904F72|nr:class I SAM-dependent methyltransferase [Herbaspirillum sp. WGmk3]MCO4857596.1 class I SAM-dependent methyltransferase [Herbaspirillum sp. WGmk3]